jgi:hypothetical protein
LPANRLAEDLPGDIPLVNDLAKKHLPGDLSRGSPVFLYSLVKNFTRISSKLL